MSKCEQKQSVVNILKIKEDDGELFPVARIILQPCTYALIFHYDQNTSFINMCSDGLLKKRKNTI